MAVKITSNFTLDRLLPDARSKASRDLKREIVDVIVEQVTAGLSPVKGTNRYKQYAPATSKKKGRTAPVTLVETGEMLNNMIAVQKRGNELIEIKFRGARNNEIASFHQFGTEHMPARPILPQTGQEFKAKIQNKIIKLIDKAFNTATKKQNR